ncbi:calcium-binding protein [Tunicatimonas pelagia]|uniref:calcium-binding protein n=1 Tax=Tunicatimonas pelagia TaxID=931531 RepID=UPI00266566FF|nr:calcium-binding protein [Tunicatimonas pelagia]WKN41847.1 calcium-binding protein [Tunicatimonas pelagia]
MKLTKEEVQEIIDYEIVVDCYTEEEANMGWAIYMEENISYPFEAEYEVKKRPGERQWKKVQVVNNETDESSFDGGDYYVEIEYEEIVIPVRIDELRNIVADEETTQALQVWQSRNAW